MKKLVILLILCIFGISHLEAKTVPTVILYHKILNNGEVYPELMLNNTISEYTSDGLNITGKEGLIRLNRYYSLGNRFVRYHVRFSDDAKAVFQSNTGDFKVTVNVPEKTLSVETKPVSWKKVDFLHSGSEYLIEIHHIYQTAKVRIIDVFTGQSDEITLTNDGIGGYGIGIINSGFYVGGQHDYYCFGLLEGTSLLVKQISVISGICNLALLIYGDSITEPDAYFPTDDYPQSWTQLIMNQVQGKSMASGRGGCTILEVLERIKNELPYIKAKYVMVTIGTNGGNTAENLSELVEYITAQGSIPILNNIPCNESGTQVEVNKLIEVIRQKYKINGCKFDLATSKAYDGKEVDKATMYHEDYSGSWGQIYHHPNKKGSLLMFTRTLIDIPEIYE